MSIPLDPPGKRHPDHRLAVLGALLVAVACGDAPAPALTLGPVSYSEDQLLGLTEARRATLADLTAFGLAVSDSSTGALGAPLVREWVDDRRLEILGAELTLDARRVDDEVLEAAYLTDPRWQLTVRHILFFSERWRSPEHREQAAAKAARAMDSLLGGADFAETASRLSEEPGAEGRQGLLTPGREGSWVPEFWAAALALEPGQISPVTETQYGYHILRLEDREVIPFSEARSAVARRVARELGDPSSVLSSWLASAATENVDASDEPTALGRRAALAEADRRGIAVPAEEEAEIQRGWDDIAWRLALTFGFRYGASPDDVALAALAALANPAQGASLARAELSDYRELLMARHPAIDAGTPSSMQP